jgi:hypothetical protein
MAARHLRGKRTRIELRGKDVSFPPHGTSDIG